MAEDSPVVQQKRLLSLDEIARRSLLPISIIKKVCENNYGNLTKTEAKKLESATGVCGEAWIFLERHNNPYVSGSALFGSNCRKTCGVYPLKTVE